MTTLIRRRPRPPLGHYGDHRIDWAGLSWRTVRGWRRGSQCLSRCDEGHTYGDRCVAGSKALGRRR